MSEMVDRVAKAIASQPCWESASEEIRETWRMEARAAIKAMREPTEAMQDAITGTLCTCDCFNVPLSSFLIAYRDMLDEALR